MQVDSNKSGLFMALGLLCVGVQANTVSPSVSGFSPVVSLSVGPVWSTGGKTQTIQSAPQVIRAYTANSTSNTIADGEFFIGVQHAITHSLIRDYLLQGQIGFAVATTSHATISGDIWDNAEPQFNNFTYAYKMSHTHLALKGKLLTTAAHQLQPYVSGSLGVGFNSSGSFSNTPAIPEATAIPDFDSHTTKTLTYTVGLGLQRAVTQHCYVGVGYEFADWGPSHLSAAPGQTMGTGIGQDHFYTNGLLFSLHYLA